MKPFLACARPIGHSRPQLLRASLAAAFAGLLAANGALAQIRGGAIDNLPALGEAAVDELSPAAEQRLGDQIFQEFLRAGVVADDPETTDFLAAQAERLLKAAQFLGHSDAARNFRFFIVNDPTLNAFALPGGYIGVHTGLLTASAREAEVMSVLAHEIGHVTQRHIARMFGQQRQSSAVMIAAAVLAAMAARASPDAAMGVLSLGQTVAIRDQLSFSRDAEREADRVGLQILAQSGYDASAMSSMFERLSQAGRLYDNNAPAYLRTHPLTTERIADIQGRIQNDPGLRRPHDHGASLGGAKSGANSAANGGGPESIQFSWVRAKLLALTDQKVDGLRTARLRFEQSLSDPKNNTAGHRGPIYFGLAWTALAQRDFKSSLSLLNQAEQQAKAAGVIAQVAPFLIYARIQAAIAADDGELALGLVKTIEQDYSNHRALVRSSIQAQILFGLGQDKAAAAARNATLQWPQDPQVWALLGRAELARANRAAHHAAIAEQYAITGAYAAAVEQLTLARTAGDGDFVAMSKIDARLTAMRAALRREQLERQQQQR